MQSELQTAITAVQQASAVCRAVQHELKGAVLEKSDRSPVTVADFASQALICRALREAFPRDPVVAEEAADELRKGAHQALTDKVVAHTAAVVPGADAAAVCDWIDHGGGDAAQRFWTLDPIDGTKGFLRGEQYAVALALIVGGEVQVAVLGCPNLPHEGGTGVVFHAVRGEGAWASGLDTDGLPQRIQASGVSDPVGVRYCESVEKAHTTHSRAARVADALGSKAGPVRMDSQCKYALVARGDAEAYMRFTKGGYVEKIWDHAAGYLVCTEAGGRASDVHGRPLDFSCGRLLSNNQGVIVTNGPIHDALIEAIACVPE